jgi:hypothetical protein
MCVPDLWALKELPRLKPATKRNRITIRLPKPRKLGLQLYQLAIARANTFNYMRRTINPHSFFHIVQPNPPRLPSSPHAHTRPTHTPSDRALQGTTPEPNPKTNTNTNTNSTLNANKFIFQCFVIYYNWQIVLQLAFSVTTLLTLFIFSVAVRN